jgi:hypothetical protein
MNIPRGNVFTLLRRNEVDTLLGREITLSEWTLVKRLIMRDKELWACLDSTLVMVKEQLGKEKS